MTDNKKQIEHGSRFWACDCRDQQLPFIHRRVEHDYCLECQAFDVDSPSPVIADLYVPNALCPCMDPARGAEFEREKGPASEPSLRDEPQEKVEEKAYAEAA